MDLLYILLWIFSKYQKTPMLKVLFCSIQLHTAHNYRLSFTSSDIGATRVMVSGEGESNRQTGEPYICSQPIVQLQPPPPERRERRGGANATILQLHNNTQTREPSQFCYRFVIITRKQYSNTELLDYCFQNLTS